MNDDAQVVSRGILREELAQELARFPTREELKETLRQELARFVTRDEFGMWIHMVAQQHERLVGAIADLRQDMKASQEALSRRITDSHEVLSRRIADSHEVLFVEIGRAARVAAEEHRRELGVIDDRYRDLPPRVATLEREVDAHHRDAALHARRPGPRKRPPRR
jgi:hypothetical protein